MEFKKLIEYIEKNKKEYLEKELNDNKEKLRKKILKRSINKNYEALKRLEDGGNMKTESKFNQLKNIIQNYGYSISFSTVYFNRKIQTGNAVDHGRKLVITMPRITEREIIGICHEIGHIKDRERFGRKRDRNKKYIRMYEEILAWGYAIPLLIKFRTPLKLTIHNIYYSLLSHWKYKITIKVRFHVNFMLENTRKREENGE